MSVTTDLAETRETGTDACSERILLAGRGADSRAGVSISNGANHRHVNHAIESEAHALPCESTSMRELDVSSDKAVSWMGPRCNGDAWTLGLSGGPYRTRRTMDRDAERIRDSLVWVRKSQRRFDQFPHK